MRCYNDAMLMLEMAMSLVYLSSMSVRAVGCVSLQRKRMKKSGEKWKQELQALKIVDE